MESRFLLCPTLPAPQPDADWRSLHAFRERDRGPEFYAACLTYAHSLWQRGLPARAMLCLDRAFAAELRGEEAVLRSWPLPYAAMAWFIRHAPAGVFTGNPRVHFQHYAERVNEPRREQRRWRAWGCWAIARAARPDLPGDPKHVVVEPTHAAIGSQLEIHGHRHEAQLWRSVIESIASP